MTYDASDRKQVRRAEKASALADRNRGEVLIRTVSDTAGRRWLWDQLAERHIFETIWNDNPHRMSFLEGQRSAGLALLADWMQWAPDEFILAMREANGRRTDSLPVTRDPTDPSTGQHAGGEEPGRVDEGLASDAAGGEEGDAT